MEMITHMTEENQQNTLGGFGTRLKTAREGQHLSQKDVALRLHLSTNIIQIIENEDMTLAPPATFMRGYLRSYAKLLNIPDVEINQALMQSGLDLVAKNAPITPNLMPVESIENGDRYVHWITMLVLSISLVLVGIWWNTHSRETNLHVAVKNPPEAATTLAPTTPQAQPTPPPMPTETTVQATTSPESPTAPSATQVNPAPATTSAEPSATPPMSPVVPDSSVLAGMTPIPATPPVTEERHKKHHRHSQDNNVSGMAMALPEPGL